MHFDERRGSRHTIPGRRASGLRKTLDEWRDGLGGVCRSRPCTFGVVAVLVAPIHIDRDPPVRHSGVHGRVTHGLRGSLMRRWWAASTSWYQDPYLSPSNHNTRPSAYPAENASHEA